MHDEFPGKIQAGGNRLNPYEVSQTCWNNSERGGEYMKIDLITIFKIQLCTWI